ncbi:MAG: PepSY domain-containing protein [Pseudomonadota bacterium]
MTFKRVAHRLHRWLALLLGVQVLLWMASGVVMTWFHIDLVRGEQNAAVQFDPELEARSYASPGRAIAQMDGVTEVTLRSFLGAPVYEVKAVSGRAIFDARTGARLSPLNEARAREIARGDYAGDAEIIALELLETAPGEYRGRYPVWRAEFDDRLSTRLYISPDTGKILARRNAVWRLHDFFWMLHIMDYGEREDFNNPLVRAASATGLAFAVSGLFLVVIRLRAGRYGRREDKTTQ